jgi:hypothetical protein
LVLDLNLLKAPANFDNFSSEFKLEIHKDSQVSAIVGWFDVEMTPDVFLSTSPFSERTHWEQAVFPLLEQKRYLMGSTI